MRDGVRKGDDSEREAFPKTPSVSHLFHQPAVVFILIIHPLKGVHAGGQPVNLSYDETVSATVLV
jgi:hypothetical protein